MHQPRKRFGQNFLINSTILQHIVSCLALQKNDRVVEIGPGKGALTEYLLHALNHLDAIELDRDLVGYLKKKFSTEVLTLREADALIFPFTTLSHASHDLRIVGNLPYNISTPLLFHLFAQIHCIRDMYFMLQKEVVLRLTAAVGDRNYSRLSVMSQYFCNNTYLFTVAASAFDPAPKVESAFVRLAPKPNAALSKPVFLNFANAVKEAFTYRRKTISNSLRRLISPQTLITLNISPKARAQDISLDEFIRIGQAISVESIHSSITGTTCK